MSNPVADAGANGVLLFEERRSDQHALPAQSGRPEVVSQAVGEAVWPYFYCAKQSTAWERCVTKQPRSATSRRRSPTPEQDPPVATSPASFLFFHASLRAIRPGGWRESHMACMCVPQRAIARQPSSPLHQNLRTSIVEQNKSLSVGNNPPTS